MPEGSSGVRPASYGMMQLGQAIWDQVPSRQAVKSWFAGPAAPSFSGIRKLPGPTLAAATPMAKAGGVIDDLKAAKAESDRKNFRGKHKILRKLMAARPHEFHVDSRMGHFLGISHYSGFRMHLPRGVVPTHIKGYEEFTGAANQAGSTTTGSDGARVRKAASAGLLPCGGHPAGRSDQANEAVPLELPVHLRKFGAGARGQSPVGYAVVRVLAAGAVGGGEHDARRLGRRVLAAGDQGSRVSHLDRDAESLLRHQRSELPAIWRAGDYGLRKVAAVRELPGGHGPGTAEDVDRAEASERALRAGKLLLGNIRGAGSKQAFDAIHHLPGQDTHADRVGDRDRAFTPGAGRSVGASRLDAREGIDDAAASPETRTPDRTESLKAAALSPLMQGMLAPRPVRGVRRPARKPKPAPPPPEEPGPAETLAEVTRTLRSNRLRRQVKVAADWQVVPATVVAMVKAARLPGWPESHPLSDPTALTGRLAVASLALPDPVSLPMDRLPTRYNARLQKVADAGFYSGGLFTPSIPVDAFNNAVWTDAWQNPFGSRSTFGDNSQPVRTPPQVAAAVSGLVAGAGASRNSSHVSPWDVAIAAGTAAGKGWLGGLVLGKTVGALAGMPPEAQRKLQDIGLWGGLLTGAVKSVFGRPE